MSLKVIRNDLLAVKCTALVNPSDVLHSGSGSIDYRIHQACGSQLENELKAYQNLEVSEVIVTASYNLKTCQNIIHAVGPKYLDGKHDEFNLLRQCYQNILNIARVKQFNSIALPLISTGTFNFPKKEAFNIAIEEINHFLEDNDLTIYLVVYDEESFKVSQELAFDVESYIDETFVFSNRLNFIDKYVISNAECNYNRKFEVEEKISYKETKQALHLVTKSVNFELDESFSEALLGIIDSKGLKDPDVYKKAGIDRKLFSTIRSKKDYRPSKKTALALCIALELDLKQTNDLLKKAGFTLSHSNLFDVIIEYFIKNHNYDFFDINAVLFEHDQELIGC